MAELSIGLPAAVPADTIREVARAAEEAGLRTFWLNDTPGADALVGLAAAAEVTDRILLGVGVVALDRWPADALAARVAGVGLSVDRLVLGVGSGGSPHPVATVEDGVRRLRDLVTAPLLVGALGPRVRRLAAEQADGLLLSWLPPKLATAARAEAIAQAEVVGRARPHVALYARTAVDPAAHPALRAEAERYASFPSYAANFARTGRGPLDGSILANDGPSLRIRIGEYTHAVDELVLRAITDDDSPAAIRRILDAAVG